MGARVSADWSYRGLRAVIMENERLRLVLLPELGGRIWEFTDKSIDRQWLWHHPRIEPRATPFGVIYDDWFFGGWDDVFPNDPPEVFEGESLADHGEVWSLPWEFAIVQQHGDEVAVQMTRSTPITPARIEREIVLRAGEPRVWLHTRLANTGNRAFAFLWKLHPALAITPGCRFHLPCREAWADSGLLGRVGDSRPFPWPKTPDGVDLSVAPIADEAVVELLYCRMEQGWFAVTDPATGSGFGLAFPREVFPFVWIFATYGGWRSLYTALLEPATGYPMKLSDAQRQGYLCRLGAGQQLDVESVAVVFTGIERVHEITPRGEVIGE